jgi:Acetyltransferase (GNAT) domain
MIATALETALAPSPQRDRSAVRLLRLTELTVADHLAWAELSRAAGADSPFAASWFTQSLLAHFDPRQDYRLFVVAGGRGNWDGVMVAARSKHLGRLPFRHLRNQLDANQFLGVPLVRRGREIAFWDSLLPALDKAGLRCNGLRLAEMPQDHRVTRALLSVSGRQGRRPETLAVKRRALWCPASGGGDPLDHLPAKRVRRIAALERQLRENHGPTTVQCVSGPAELDKWLAEFVALEAAGWKGAKASALASKGQAVAHFRHVAHSAHAQGVFHALGLRVGDRPIAMTCYFLDGTHGFGFKMAYDEGFARYAPGILLLKELMRALTGVTGLRFDSCSGPDAAMINELWPDRREIADITIPIGQDAERSRFAATMAARRWWHRAKFWKPGTAPASPC